MKYVAFICIVIAITIIAPHYIHAAPMIDVHEEYIGSGVRRLVFSAQSDIGFRAFSVAFSFDNTVIEPHIPANAFTTFQGTFPIRVLLPGWNPMISTFADAVSGRSGYHFSFFGGFGHPYDTSVPIFAFYYRLVSTATIDDLDMDTIRIENGVDDSFFIVQNGIDGGAVITDGVFPQSYVSWVWGAVDSNAVHVIPHGNLSLVYESSTRVPRPSISLNGDILSWSAVNHAVGYRIYADGNYVTSIASNSANLAALPLLVGDRQMHIVAFGTSSQVDSLASNAVTYHMFAGPSFAVDFVLPMPGIGNTDSFLFYAVYEDSDLSELELLVEISCTGDLPLYAFAISSDNLFAIYPSVITIPLGQSDVFYVSPNTDIEWDVGVHTAEIVIASGTIAHTIMLELEIVKAEDEIIINPPPEDSKEDEEPKDDDPNECEQDSNTGAGASPGAGTASAPPILVTRPKQPTPVFVYFNQYLHLLEIPAMLSECQTTIEIVPEFDASANIISQDSTLRVNVSAFEYVTTVLLPTEIFAQAYANVVLRIQFAHGAVSMHTTDDIWQAKDILAVTLRYTEPNMLYVSMTSATSGAASTFITVYLSTGMSPSCDTRFAVTEKISGLKVENAVVVDGYIIFRTSAFGYFMVWVGDACDDCDIQPPVLTDVPRTPVQAMYFQIPLYQTGLLPFIDTASGRTMVSVRTISEAFDTAVSWDSHRRAVNIYTAHGTRSLIIDEPLPYNMGTAVIINNHAFAPLRYIADMMGASVRWDGDNRVVFLYV